MRGYLFVAVGFLYLFFLFPCFDKVLAEDIAPDMRRILDRGRIIVAMVGEDAPPFFFHNKKGEFHGFDVELARDIAGKLGIEVEFNRNAKTYDEVVDIVSRKEADVAISWLSSTLGRAKRVRFSKPYVTLHQAVFINRLMLAQHKGGEKDPLKVINSKSAKLGVVAGTSYVGFAKENFPNAVIILYEDWDTAMRDVVKGNIFAVIFDEVEVGKWNRAHPETVLYVQPVVLEGKDPLAFAVHWEDEHLLSWLNLYLEMIEIDGTSDRLYKMYLGSEEWQKK